MARPKTAESRDTGNPQQVNLAKSATPCLDDG
jgi:hypothetical protein